jgi:hypothetical protein
MYIPIDQRLQPTDHLEKVRGANFYAVDASERIVGKPITP